MQDVCVEGNAEADESMLHVETFQDNSLVAEASTHPYALLHLQDLVATHADHWPAAQKVFRVCRIARTYLKPEPRAAKACVESGL